MHPSDLSVAVSVHFTLTNSSSFDSSSRGIKKLIHVRASAKPVSSAVLLLEDATPENARWRGSHVTGPQRIRTRLSGETAGIPQPAALVPTAWRLKPPCVKSLQLGDSIPVILTAASWQHGELFSALAKRKASGLSCSGLKPKHIVWYVWAHAGHREVIILILPYKFFEIETKAPVGSSQVGSRDECRADSRIRVTRQHEATLHQAMQNCPCKRQSSRVIYCSTCNIWLLSSRKTLLAFGDPPRKEKTAINTQTTLKAKSLLSLLPSDGASSPR